MALVIAIVGLPVTAGIAILRYRLYDLDVLLNRTLVYSTGHDRVGRRLRRDRVGRRSGARWCRRRRNRWPERVVVSRGRRHVGGRGVFQPARKRVQELVDRRFNWRRYNAQRTPGAFVAQLRVQPDLDALVTELLAVVDRTMEPTRVSL